MVSGTVSTSTRRVRVIVHPDGSYILVFLIFLGKNYIIYVVIIFTHLYRAILVMTEHKFMKREMSIIRTPHIRPVAVLLLLMAGI